MEEGRDATLHEWYESYLSRFLLQKWYFSINKKKFVLQKNLYQILIRTSPPPQPRRFINRNEYFFEIFSLFSFEIYINKYINLSFWLLAWV